MFTSLLISLLLSGNVLAKDDIQKEIRVLFKCHGQLVRERLNPTHFLVKEIQNKKINGSEACLKLLETAEFSEKGLLKEENNFSSQKILKTIQAPGQQTFRL